MNTLFRPAFSAVLFLTVASGGTAFYLAAQPNPSKEQVELCEVCIKTWGGGTLSIVGLLKARKPPGFWRLRIKLC